MYKAPRIFSAMGYPKDGRQQSARQTERAANMTKARALFAKYYTLTGPITEEK